MSDHDDDEEFESANSDALLMPCPSSYPKVKIGMIDVDVRTLLNIEPEGLVSDYQTIHHWIVTFSHKVSQMTLAISSQKRKIARLEARLYRSFRAASSEKKPTESAIKNSVVLDQQFQDEQDKLDSMEAEKARYANVMYAVENKRDMIVNMGAELRNRKRKDRNT